MSILVLALSRLFQQPTTIVPSVTPVVYPTYVPSTATVTQIPEPVVSPSHPPVTSTKTPSLPSTGTGGLLDDGVGICLGGYVSSEGSVFCLGLLTATPTPTSVQGPSSSTNVQGP